MVEKSRGDKCAVQILKAMLREKFADSLTVSEMVGENAQGG